MISIVITYVDETRFLREALGSALQQESIEAEIIVVCNNRFMPVEDTHLAGDSSNVTWVHEPIPGSAFARNKGLQIAAGDWIQFLDVDDLLLPQKIARQMNEDGGAIVSPHMYRHLDGSIEKSKWLPDDIWVGLLDSGLGSTSSMIWNREALLKAGGWSVEYQSHQEYELLFRIAATGLKLVCIDAEETIVRERSTGSITQRTKDVRTIEGIRLREAMWKYLVENSMDTPGRKKAFLRYVFRQLRGLYRTDPAAAIKIYSQYFKGKKFKPEFKAFPFYPVLYQVLGFNRTERFMQFYRGVRDRYLPFLPKNN